MRQQIQGLEHWEQIEHHMIVPRINQVLETLPQLFSGAASERWDDWRDRYIPELLSLLRGLRREATERSRVRAAMVTSTIDPLLPASRRVDSLSRKAIWVLSSTPGVTCVLNGMRSPHYVDDALAVLRWEPLRDAMLVYDRMKTVACA
jgi:hypothetical protein